MRRHTQKRGIGAGAANSATAPGIRIRIRLGAPADAARDPFARPRAHRARTAREAARSLVVQKYGGSSVADAESVKRVPSASWTPAGGNDVVVVVSAMATHDELIDLAKQVTPLPPAASWTCCSPRERISHGVAGHAIANLGHEARVHRQPGGVITDRCTARPGSSTSPGRIMQRWMPGDRDRGRIPGVSQDTKDITTLAGAARTHAVALPQR